MQYLAALSQSESLLLAGNAADDGDGAYAEVTTKLDGFLLDLLRQLARRRQDDGVRTQLRILEPSATHHTHSLSAV